MDSEIKKILNKKLDAQALPEVAPAFDKDELWSRLLPRVEGLKKRRAMPVWWSYAAAAMLIGIAVGGVGLKWLSRPAYNAMPEVAAALSQQYREVKPVIINTVPAVASAPEVAKSEKRKVNEARSSIGRHKNESHLVVPENKEQVAYQQQVSTSIEDTVTAAPIVYQRKQQPRAVHLLDLNSEDRTAVINTTEKHAVQNHFSFYISPDHTPGGSDGHSNSSLLRLHLR